MEGKERLFPKLDMRYYGPFQVCDKISDVAYRLKSPEGWKIHNAFHVSLPRPFVGNVPEDMVTEEQPEVEELDEILVPEQILAHKDRKVRGKVARRYLMDSQKRQILLSWICSNAVSEHKANWEHYLPLVENAHNNTVHTSTGKAPFEIVEGGKKVPPILQIKDKIFKADKYVQNTDEAYRKIKLALEKTQSKQKKAVDRHRRELLFSWILLRFEKARSRKMEGKERLFPKLDMVPEEQPEVEELDEILVPEQILAHKDRKVRGKGARRYLVKFKNYSPMDAKWMEEADLVDSPQLLQLYLEAFQLQPTVN
ncbi:hypothetical protein L7F22_017991 [Adiantum nelumboides]|nr:hypothetical protein [Adiantum nelumboides]